MKTTFERNHRRYEVDLSQPIADLSMPVGDVARAWYIPAPTYSPVVLGDWVGSVAEGGGVNFFNLAFNPHAHGTHTETAGHITPERHSIHKHFRDPFTWALLLTLTSEKGIITFDHFMEVWKAAEKSQQTSGVKAVIFRTETREQDALGRNYSSTDWPYLDAAIGSFLRNCGVDHLLIDQPSVDKEEDGGALACHRTFWGPTPEETLHRTISELLHIPSSIPDGNYLLNLQVAPLENDAAPSRPLLFEAREVPNP